MLRAKILVYLGNKRSLVNSDEYIPSPGLIAMCGHVHVYI